MLPSQLPRWLSWLLPQPANGEDHHDGHDDAVDAGDAAADDDDTDAIDEAAADDVAVDADADDNDDGCHIISPSLFSAFKSGKLCLLLVAFDLSDI